MPLVAHTHFGGEIDRVVAQSLGWPEMIAASTPHPFGNVKETVPPGAFGPTSPRIVQVCRPSSRWEM
jgi:hypothetical protein